MGCVRAHRNEALLVESAQHFGLGLQAHVADFVEKQRTAVGALERAALLRRPAGDGAVAIAEELALDVVLGNGGAVQLNENAVAAQASGVDGAGDQLFARAGFAINENAAVGGRHERDLLAESAGLDAFAGDLRFERKLAAEFDVFGAQSAGFDRIFDDDERALEHQRLFKEVEGAEFGGFHGGLDGGVAGDDDDLGTRRGIERAQLAPAHRCRRDRAARCRAA